MFTSRVPKSIKRSASTAGESTSFNRIPHRHTNIPATVKKANLFTPQNKNRTFSTGASTVGKSGINTDKKYQRPAPEIPEQMEMFEELVEFLKVNAPHLPQPEPKRFFSSISTTESTRIFELLIGKLLPDFKISRLEIDVPQALSILEYPYLRSVTKSALVSVTTRPASVGLLTIFCWLINSINVVSSRSLDYEGGEISELYKIILQQPEQVDDAIENLAENLRPMHLEDEENLLQEINSNNIEIKALAKELKEREALQLEIETLNEDIKKQQSYNDEMSRLYIPTKRDEDEKLRQREMQYTIQIEEKSRRIDILKQQIKDHEFTTEEVLRLKNDAEAKELKLQVATEQAAKKEEENKHHHKEHMTMLNSRKEEEKQRLIHLKKEFEKRKNEMLRDIEVAKKKGEEAEASYLELKELSEKCLNSLMQQCRKKKLNMIHEARQEKERLLEINRVIKENAKVVKWGMKQLRKKGLIEPKTEDLLIK